MVATRWSSALTLLCCGSSVFCSGARGDFTPTVYEARRVAVAPVIDGDLSDPAWALAQPIGPFFAYQSGGDPPAAETTLRLMWDDTHLFISMEGQDEDIRSSCVLAGDCGDDASLFNGDVLELFLRETTRRVRYHEFQWSPLGEKFDARFDTRFGSPGIAWDSQQQSAVSINGTVDDASDTDTGWIVEARVPFSAMTSAPVEVGDEWTFTGARYDYFNRALPARRTLMMSTPGDPDAPNGGVTAGFHTYEIYDTLRFAEGIPEPSTALMVALGCAGGVIRRRR